MNALWLSLVSTQVLGGSVVLMLDGHILTLDGNILTF